MDRPTTEEHETESEIRKLFEDMGLASEKERRRVLFREIRNSKHDPRIFHVTRLSSNSDFGLIEG